MSCCKLYEVCQKFYRSGLISIPLSPILPAAPSPGRSTGGATKPPDLKTQVCPCLTDINTITPELFYS